MGQIVSLGSVLAQVAARCDWPPFTSSSFVTRLQAVDFVNARNAELYDLLVATCGDEYFEQETTLATAPNVPTASLPDFFYKETGVFWQSNAGTREPIRKYMPKEAEPLILGVGWNYNDQVRYRLRVDTIRFVPTPLAVHTVILKWIRSAPRLVSDDDVFDGYNGWELYVILGAAIDCLSKEESTEQAQALVAERQRIESRILALAARDHNEPDRIQDVTSYRYRVGAPWR